jgi:glycosyltransferase involved in cell wall biosynthesis
MSVNVSVLSKIKQMGLFDPEFYLSHYPVTNESKTGDSDEYSELLEHYLEIGWIEGFDPSEKFSTSDYICNYGNEEKVEGNPLLHFVQYGVKKNLLIHEHRELPKFSLIMPTYNRKDRINDAIQSVLNQRSDFDIEYELIIADDGSTDGTVEMLTSMYATELSNRKIKLLSLEHRGVCTTRNTAVAQARFPWICYIDSDNAVLPAFLETFYKKIIKKPYCQFFYAQHYLVSEQKITEHEFCRPQLLKGNFIDLGSICHTKKLFEKIGGFDESLTRLVDWDLILRMTAIAEPIYIPTIVMNYNSNSDYHRITNSVQPRQNAVAIADKNRVESLIYDSLEKIGQYQEEQIRRTDEIVGTVQGLKEYQEKQKNRTDEIVGTVQGLKEYQEEQIRRIDEIVGTVQGLKECQEKQSNQMKDLTELVGVLNTGLVSKYVLLKYKILKSITFGSLHQKYKRIYKSLKMIHSKIY